MNYGLGLIATLLGIVGALPYIYNTYKRKTKPHRFAWLIFLILSVISFASQFSLGARASLFFFGWFVINNTILVSLSFRKNGGYGGITKVNVTCFLIAIASIALWKTTDSPFVALICALVADGIGAMMIVVKSYKHPGTETMVMWAFGIVASLLNIIAVGELEFSKLVAPIQVFLFSIAIVTAIMIGRKRESLKQFGRSAA